MYSFRISKVAPFWARNNENKPNETIFNKWLDDNMEEVNNLPIHFFNFTTITFNDFYNNYKYIEIKNTLDENDVRYYYLDAIEIDGGNNTYKYRGVLDVYTSYTLKFIKDNKDIEFVFLRQHEYDKRCLQIRDSYLDEIPKIYTSYFFKKVNFNTDGNSYYGSSIGVMNNGDLVNANKYYVFKDGVNGGYTFYPILSKTLNVDLLYQEKIKGSVKKDIYYWNGRAGSGERVEISDELNNAVVDAYKNNEIVEFLYHSIKGDGLAWRDWKAIENVPYGTLPVDVRANSNQWNHAGAGIKRASFDVYLLGNNVYHVRTGNTLAWDFDNQWNKCKEFRQLRVKIYNTTSKWNQRKVKNSITDLEVLRKKEENINKFLGIYYLPHFFNFDSSRLNFQDDYVYININPQSDNIGLFSIYEYQQSNITDKINNSSYSTEYFLRYLNIKYYGNPINAEYRTNEQHKIFIGGLLFFTDTANIICKSNEFVSLDNSIISYPYMLPIGVDTYEQYVKANRNITDTGFSIARKQQELAFAKSIVGGVMGVGIGVTQAIGGALTGNVGAAIGGATKAINAPIDMGFGIAGQMQGLANQKAMIRAQYQQANNTMGSEMKFSNIETASLMEYYDDDSGEQYEGVEVSELEPNVLILMNNYIYLNGYMLPNNSTFKNKIENDRDFNYIQLDVTLLQNQLNIRYDNGKYNNEIYQMIMQQLTNGIRVWNKLLETLPIYDENTAWPDQPDYDRPVIPNPEPPIKILNLDYEVSDKWIFTNKSSTGGYTTEFMMFDSFNKNIHVQCYNNVNNDFVCGNTPWGTDRVINDDVNVDEYEQIIVNIDFSNFSVNQICKLGDDTQSKFILFELEDEKEMPEPNLIINFNNVSDEVKQWFTTHNQNYYKITKSLSPQEKGFKVATINLNGVKIYGN